MLRSLLVPALLFCLSVAGCDPVPDGRSGPPGGSDEVVPIVIDTNVEPGEYPNDDYRILDVVGTDTLRDRRPEVPTVTVGTLETDTLGLQLQYGGGCEDHEFYLVAAASFMESAPVQARVRLFHDDNGDRCEALVTETVRFNLEPLKEQYEDMYGRASGVMLLNLDLEREKQLRVRYQF